MDLTRRLARFGYARPHVFVLAWPGTLSLRLDLETDLRARGWPRAASPADTDVLLVLTPHGALPGDAQEIVERFWDQTPQPRARAVVSPGTNVPAVLDAACAAVLDRAATSDTPAPDPTTRDGAGSSAASDVEAAAHHDAGHGTHEHMHGDAQEMEMPGGLPLADEAPDRDGLTLDVLHLGLGPALPWWPEGIRLNVAVQGDVVQTADLDVIAPCEQVLPVDPQVLALDTVRRVLFAAGDDGVAWRTERLRDDLRSGSGRPAEVERLTRVVTRRRVLRAMLRRVPAGDHDVWHILEQWLAAARGESTPPQAQHLDAGGVSELFVGRELSEVSLIARAVDLRTAAVSLDG